ncbi:MAG: YtxH domain-containing protein [Anaerolineae bacterium]
MSSPSVEHGYVTSNAGGFFTGLLIGSLLGAAAMLLLAPQSGEKTRHLIQREGRDLRDQVTESVEDVVLPARQKARQMMSEVRKQAKELGQRGQDALDEQKDIAADVVDAEKKAAENIANG